MVSEKRLESGGKSIQIRSVAPVSGVSMPIRLVRQLLRLAALVLVLAGPAVAQIDLSPREGRRALGLNLAEVTGWNTGMPFIDQMRNGVTWVGHTGSGWGGMDQEDLFEAGALDADGWVVAFPRNVRRISTFVLMEIPAGMTSAAGTWHARWEGTAHLGFVGAARDVRYGDNSATFSFTPGDGAVLIEFNRGTLSNLTVVHERNLEMHAAGALFNPDWLARVGDVAVMRFMDWMRTNGSEVQTWDQRPRLSDYSWARRGVPLEVMLRLANETGADPWFTLPHLADDDYVRRFAEMVRDGLGSDLRAWFEFSNEVWNWSFPQADWAEQAARARWNREWAWVQYGAVRAAEVMRVIDTVYAGQELRRVRVLGLFTAWLELEADMLAAPDYVAENSAHRPPREFFDALAVTGYFSGELHAESRRDRVQAWLAESRVAATTQADALGLTGEQRDTHIAAHRFDLAIQRAGVDLIGGPEHSVRHLLDTILAHHVRIARENGMALVMYEGGTHVVTMPQDHGDTELVAFFEALNYSEVMGEAYRVLLEGWQALTPAPFVAYYDIGRPTIWGSWGQLRHLEDDTPRWRALMDLTAR